MILRTLDILFSLLGLIFGLPILFVISIVGFFDTGSPILRQNRLGRGKKPFTLVKFRTMSKETLFVPTHLVNSRCITYWGSILRQTKLDELPQLWNVLTGDMSLVGPRPNLIDQQELIEARDLLNIYSVRPGITGLSQINKIDMSSPKLLALTDAEMITNMSLKNYFKYIFLTLCGKGTGDRVR